MADTVLFPIRDFAPWTQAACRKLADIERETGASVVLLYPFAESDIEHLQTAITGGESTAMPAADKIARERVKETDVETILEESEIPFEIVGLLHDGEPARAILETADRKAIDRIYLFSRNRSPVGKATFGSTAQKILFSAGVPVVVVPPASLEY